jgi:hypothetical protein
LKDLLEFISSQKWHKTLIKMNDIEYAKNNTQISFFVEGKKNTMFIEESKRLIQEIERNLLKFFQTTNSISKQILAQIITENCESLQTVSFEIKSLRMKMSEFKQVSVDEINEVCKSVNTPLYNELTITQKQQLYLKTAGETSKYLEEKLMILQNLVEMAVVLSMPGELKIVDAVERLLSLELKEKKLLEMCWGVMKEKLKGTGQ